MRFIARWTGVRIAAVIMLLSLRPSLLIISLGLHNARANGQPAIQLIALSEAALHLHASRPDWFSARASATGSIFTTPVLSSVALEVPSFWTAVSIAVPVAAGIAHGDIAGARAPPL